MKTMPIQHVILVGCVLVALGSLCADTLVARDWSVAPRGQEDLQPYLAHERIVRNFEPPATGLAKTETDTTYLLGGPSTYNGKFETRGGSPDWHGWTSKDFTYSESTHWKIDTFNAENLNDQGPGNHAMWCGEMYPACDPPDVKGGYGNTWTEVLEMRLTVPDPSTGTDVRVTAAVNIDIEPGYDALTFLVRTPSDHVTVEYWDGQWTNEQIDLNFTVSSTDYVGENNDQIALRWNFNSDGSWSDEDCLFSSVGACQLDDIAVYLDDVLTSFTDFETEPQPWQEAIPPYVGDFAQLMADLEDLDPCIRNRTPQVIFIDDGIVVPGTGGTPCTTWCYGPGGWVVTTDGGLAGEDYRIENGIISPVIEWSDSTKNGGILRFTAYTHEPAVLPFPQIFYLWYVRSVNTGDPADLEFAPWRHDNFLYHGGPAYRRHEFNVTPYLELDPTHVQVLLKIWQVQICSQIGHDGTPAPYFDNVSLAIFEQQGPILRVREENLASDTFPESGELDLLNLGSNSCRFDMARDIAFADGLYIVHGDSITVDIDLVREGSTLYGTPRLVYTMQTNPLFDPYRIGFPTSGSVDGFAAYPFRWTFDLPDSSWFFPGDIIHYYIEAQDEFDGDIGTTTMPYDLTGFGDFGDELSYNSNFTVRALPTLMSATPGDQPRILLWNDFGGRGGQEEWTRGLQSIGYWAGLQYDVFYTHRPEWTTGQGLGTRATAAQLAYYDVILYTSGDLAANTLATPHYHHNMYEAVLLENWFQLGGKKALLTGDNIAHDLALADVPALYLLNDRIGATVEQNDVAPLISNQLTPTVLPLTGNSVFDDNFDWLAYGGCPDLNTFDAILPAQGCEVLAEFSGPDGNGGQYPYAAATYYQNPADNSEVILLPFDLASIYTPLESEHGVTPTRAVVLDQVLRFFGQPGGGPLTAAPEADVFAFTTATYPNPFNPKVHIEYTAPERGRLAIEVFDVRGQRVRTLLSEEVEAGPSRVSWDGTDDAGRSVAAGVYFSRIRTAGQTRVDKMTMLK